MYFYYVLSLLFNITVTVLYFTFTEKNDRSRQIIINKQNIKEFNWSYLRAVKGYVFDYRSSESASGALPDNSTNYFRYGNCDSRSFKQSLDCTRRVLGRVVRRLKFCVIYMRFCSFICALCSLVWFRCAVRVRKCVIWESERFGISN